MMSSDKRIDSPKLVNDFTSEFTGYFRLLNLVSVPALIFEGKQKTIITTNKLFANLSGLSEEHLSGKNLDQFIVQSDDYPSNNGDQYKGLLVRADKPVIPINYSITSLEEDHSCFALLINNFRPESKLAIRDMTKDHEHLFEIILYLLTAQDADELDYSIKNSLNVFSLIIGSSNICIYQANSDYPGLKKMIACDSEHVFPEEIPPSDLMRLKRLNLWRPGTQMQTEIHKAGRIADLRYVASIPLGQKGALTGLLVIGGHEPEPASNLPTLMQFFGTIISTKTQNLILEANLRNQIFELENKTSVFEELFNSTKDGVIILSSSLSVHKMNATAELLLGYAENEVQGQLVENILVGPDNLFGALEKALTGIPIHNLGTVQIHRRDGQAFPANLQIIPVIKNEQLIAILIFIVDVSKDETIRIQTQQLEHRAVLGEFTAIFAHEVRNPINNISTGLQLMSSIIQQDDPNQEIINRMLGDCNRLNHLMESVLSFSRPLETKFEPVDIANLLQRILDRWRPRLTSLDIKLFYQPINNLPKIMGDMRSLEQVFTNLISNAVESMRIKGGTLAVRISKFEGIANNPQVEIAITDSGPGIPDELKNRIFEPFISNSPRGTGLGLAITKRIVTAHHGTIKVDTFPGGTVFRVYLQIYYGEANEFYSINNR